ncbi:MAG: hypothetical protein NXH81_07295 [Halieaceae bacterium]|uniref:hypothetical protein n=1 Tax=Haliea alexandrii TaxID=2448162 RepID=UPI000F0B3337|nr:hypothetical protein [Haliea alexandrii]MCR9185183.1 hypothetical protein [Halieaceae bacterium]
MREGEASAPAQGANQYSHGKFTYVFEARHTTIVHVAVSADSEQEARQRIMNGDPLVELYDSEPDNLVLILRRSGGDHGA